MVLSNNDGCVVARSNEAKVIGIPMGLPLFKCEQLIKKHSVLVYSSNYSLYGDMSARVMQTIEQFAPTIERYSIDEAFVDVSEINATRRYSFALFLRKTIYQWTGIPVSIGVGPTKTLAKIANKIAKKRFSTEGVFVIDQKINKDQLLQTVPVEDVWGVGRRYKKLLHAFRITTAKELKECDDRWVKKRMTVQGLRIVWELRGVSCFSLENEPQPKKAIAHSRSFGRPVMQLHELEESVAEYVAQAAVKLRKQKSLTNTLYVYLMTSRFIENRVYRSSVVPLPVPSNDTSFLIQQATWALRKLFCSGYAYKKVGVMLFDLVPEEQVQLDAFAPCVQTEKRKGINTSIDAVNKKWGRRTLFYAAQGIKQKWISKKNKKSQRFTTSWYELPVVR